jgi:hypothetical protein
MSNPMEDGQQQVPSADVDQRLAQLFRHKAATYARARAVSLTLLVQFGEVALLTRIQDGQVVAIDELSSLRPLTSFDFSIKASAAAWLKFWEPIPQAGSHDIFALTRHGQMQIQGNLHPLMSNLQFIKDLLAIGRGSVQ